MPTPRKSGPAFLINTITNSDQFGPAITGLANGRFVVTWTDASGSAPDFGSLAVRAQIFSANGSPVGAEFLVNTTLTDAQDQPQITALSGGGFAIAFQDRSLLNTANPDSADVRVQVFGANGAKIGAEFVAPATSAAVQSEPVIAGLKNDRYVVVWTDSGVTGGDTSGDAIRSQVFNADGTRFGVERLVNTTTLGPQNDPTVTALANGDYVVAWTSIGVDPGGQTIRSSNAQLFHPNGVAVGGEYVGNTTAGIFAGQSEPAITALSGGRYVLTWTNISGFDTNIQAQTFSAKGAALGGAFTVNATTANGQGDASIAALRDGGVVVVWVDNVFSGGTFNPEIRGQAFHANGNLNGAEFLVNSETTGVERAPSVTALADGRFVVSWEDLSGTLGDTSFAVHAQIFDPRFAPVTLTGTALGDDFVGTRFGDTLLGNGGNDTLAGAAGTDVLTGGAGSDVFVFAPKSGADQITDFTDGADRIDLSAYGFASFAAARGHFANVGADCVFTVGADVLTVAQFNLSLLGAADLLL